MALWTKERSVSVHTTPVFSGKEPLPTEPNKSDFPNVAEFEKKDLAYKKRIRILRFLSRTASLILNAIMMSTLSYTLAKYYLTRNHIIAGNLHPWITPTIVWPTFMLLAVATITFFMNLFTLLAYCCGVGAANKVSSVAGYVGYVFLVGHFIAWVIAVGAYKIGSTAHSLWAYSCSDASDQIQEQVQSFLNFGKLCTMQQGTWYISIIEAITYLLTFVVMLLVMKRASHQKKLAKVRESTLSYGSACGQDAELGTAYKAGF